MVSDLFNEERKKGPWLSGHIGSLFKAQTLRQYMVVGGGLKRVYLSSIFPEDVNR